MLLLLLSCLLSSSPPEVQREVLSQLGPFGPLGLEGLMTESLGGELEDGHLGLGLILTEVVQEDGDSLEEGRLLLGPRHHHCPHLVRRCFRLSSQKSEKCNK